MEEGKRQAARLELIAGSRRSRWCFRALRAGSQLQEDKHRTLRNQRAVGEGLTETRLRVPWNKPGWS